MDLISFDASILKELEAFVTSLSAVSQKVTQVQHSGRDPFNQNPNRSDQEKWTTSKGGPVFSKLFRLDRTDPLSFGPKFPEILVEWIAPSVKGVRYVTHSS